MKATVYKSTGSWYVTRTEDGRFINARMKGVFKIDDITSTNPIAVGDEVEIELENDADQTAMITELHDRRNYITRQSPHKKGYQKHIVASNIDQLMLIATLKEPRTSQGFLDRFLVSAEAFHIPAIITFNKFDLYRKKELEKFEYLADMYQSIGYQVFSMSLLKNEGVDEIKEVLANKTTLLSGHSGVGKSSFLNAIFPELNLRTKDVSSWSGKGMHTTTFAEMFDLPFGGRVIDTPGVREFGIVEISKQELSHYFPEMRSRLQDCQFNNCLHLNEPGCAVKNAVVNEEIDMERYLSYCSILESIEEKNY
ncbi:MAG TPA: ribosome small subunit-dependent GTPase A [Parasegetibacter sp.]